MRIDICIPAFNEEAIIAQSVRSVQDILHTLPHESRVIVAENGSTDNTARAAAQAGAHVVSVRKRGKGVAVITAARASQANIFGFIDADLSAEPSDIPRALSHLLEDKCDIVAGSRLLDIRIVQREWFRTITSYVFNVLRQFLLGVPVRDAQCGFKFMNRKSIAVLATCEEYGWFFDTEFLARAERTGLRILEFPVHWDEHRSKGRSSKLRTVRDSLGAVVALLRIWFRLRTM